MKRKQLGRDFCFDIDLKRNVKEQLYSQTPGANQTKNVKEQKIAYLRYV